MINFAIHEVRAGLSGASEDFEQMLGLLVQATQGEANLIFANRGDWGIDVLVGDLQGSVTIWQAKYFVRGFKDSQKGNVRESFNAARKAATEHGYAVARWVLCIPSSMDPAATQWWQRWKTAQQRDTGVSIGLWDETELRRLLLRREADPIRRHYYDLYAQDIAAAEQPEAPEPTGPSSSPPSAPVATQPQPVWVGGAELRVLDSAYLLHDEASERPSPDKSWVWREATADQIEPAGGRIRLRQVEIVRRVVAAEQQLAGLRAQARLLRQMNGRVGLPRLLGTATASDRFTVVTVHPWGAPWAEVFGPSRAPMDRLTAARVLSSAASLCPALHALHERGASHRALHPKAMVVSADRCFLRDAGLAEIPMATEEGELAYRAPEQYRAPYATGAWTDIYQLAAVVYHTLTGHPPSPAGSPPICGAVPGFPPQPDQVLLAALGADPAGRPAAATALESALRAGRAELSREAHR